MSNTIKLKRKGTRKGGPIRNKKPKGLKLAKPRGLTSKQVHLASEIKKINERINQLEKKGYTGTPAYSKIVTAKYGEQNIITTKKAGVKTPTAKQGTKGGGLKIRTDVKNMSEDELKAVENLIKEFQGVPSTITEIKKSKSDLLDYYKKYSPDDDITEDDITDDMLQQYLEDIEVVSSEAIAKAFYTKEWGFSDLYYRSEAGEKYQDLKKEVINELVNVYRTQGFTGDLEPYDKDIIQLFYKDKLNLEGV